MRYPRGLDLIKFISRSVVCNVDIYVDIARVSVKILYILVSR